MTEARGPIGRYDLEASLRRLGITSGDAVLVHAHLEPMGEVIGGARALIEAMVSVIGKRGLIVMPAPSCDALLPEIASELDSAARAALEAQVPGFDPERSDARAAGTLAEAFRNWPGVLRSRHPISAIAAYGPEAAGLVNHHPRDWAFGPDGPMGRLNERGGAKVLLAGAGWADCTALHTAETIARYRRLSVTRFKDVSQTPPRWIHARDVSKDRDGLFDRVGAAFEDRGLVQRGTLGLADARLFPLDELLSFAAPWIASAVSQLTEARQEAEGPLSLVLPEGGQTGAQAQTGARAGTPPGVIPPSGSRRGPARR